MLKYMNVYFHVCVGIGGKGKGIKGYKLPFIK